MTVRDSKVKKRPSLFDFVFSTRPSGLSFLCALKSKYRTLNYMINVFRTSKINWL